MKNHSSNDTPPRKVGVDWFHSGGNAIPYVLCVMAIYKRNKNKNENVSVLAKRETRFCISNVHAKANFF